MDHQRYERFPRKPLSFRLFFLWLNRNETGIGFAVVSVCPQVGGVQLVWIWQLAQGFKAISACQCCSTSLRWFRKLLETTWGGAVKGFAGSIKRWWSVSLVPHSATITRKAGIFRQVLCRVGSISVFILVCNICFSDVYQWNLMFLPGHCFWHKSLCSSVSLWRWSTRVCICLLCSLTKKSYSFNLQEEEKPTNTRAVIQCTIITLGCGFLLHIWRH